MNVFLRALMRMSQAAVLVAGLLAGLPAQAADELDAIRQRVAQVEVLRGEFSQEKQMAGFNNPLRSQGSFLLARERGVVWTTLKPFPSEMVLTGDRILSRQRDGSRRIELDGRQQPALRSVNAMMFALMSGDVQALSASFQVEAELLPGDGWRLRLTPRPGMLAKAFTALRLSGDRYVREVEIEEANQDRTTIRFSALSETPAQLSAEEGRRFD